MKEEGDGSLRKVSKKRFRRTDASKDEVSSEIAGGVPRRQKS